jgi:alpha-beta hydrolase superfamily lysophospholipase
VLVSTASVILVVLGWLLTGKFGAPFAGSARAAQSVTFPPPDLLLPMRDGFVLPARVWRPAPGVAPAGVILALHGFTDSRDAWEYPAPAFTAAGYTVVAPDQRGFGATADRGTWAGQEVMIDDAAELAGAMRARFPGQRLILMGESMGAAIAVCLAARAPETADAYVIESPAVWGRAQMAPSLRLALWAASGVAPSWKFTGNEVPLDIAASDNREALLRLAHDPLTLRGTTISMLRGLVDLMDSAQAAAPNLPATALVLNGRRDQVVPQDAIAAFWAKLPPNVRRGLYLGGFHLLFRDTGRALVEQDVVAWLAHPGAWLPSGADINAAAWQADHAWQAGVSAAAPAATLETTTGRTSWPY